MRKDTVQWLDKNNIIYDEICYAHCPKTKEIEEADFNSDKVEKLGFLDYGKLNYLFKGFIPLNTRIKYSNLSIEDYGMQTIDYMYEFAYFIKKYNINTKGALIHNLEYYINSYFGMPGNGDREQIFNEVAWNTTTTDEEYFAALENNKLGDLIMNLLKVKEFLQNDQTL
jgi:hypothetical protein